jgi:hypothetical protein
MIIWCRRPSAGLGLLANEIRNLGGAVTLLTGFGCPAGAIHWGQGGGDKYVELERLVNAGIPVPPHSRVPHPGWLARTTHHKEARDLLAGLIYGDYYVEYVPTTQEHRVHVVEGKVVRVQGKIPRVPDPHPRYRSWRSGWKLVATPACTDTLPPAARDLAKRAVAALGYKFGAVDIGTQANGEPIVFEVNSQPGLKGSTVRCYAQAFIREFA